MKKQIVLLIGFIFCVSFLSVGCARSKKTARPTIKLITDASGVENPSLNASAWQGILSFYGDSFDNTSNNAPFYDLEVCDSPNAYVQALTEATEKRYNMICVVGAAFADALHQVARINPDQKYMIIDVDWIDLPNVTEFVFAEEEGAYLIGAIAALQSIEEGIDNPSFGFVGGRVTPSATKSHIGFIQGVLSILPEASFVDYYSDDIESFSIVKRQAKSWYDAGVYAIFSATGKIGKGAIAQAREYRSHGRKVWAIGTEYDQHDDGLLGKDASAVLTSMIKNVDVAIEYMLKQIEANRTRGKVVRLDLNSKGLSFTQANRALKVGISDKINTIMEDIISGKITVYSTYLGAMRAGAVPEGVSSRY
ncbi:MAG: BMP family lipoprotein [Treponemataceae bacterium]